MRHRYSLFILGLITGGFYMSCQPSDDPVPPDISDQLKRRYCNDPFAVNYNDSFPGIPDNDRCYYPNDLVKGEWRITDSIYRPDGEFIEYTERDISFDPIDTEERNTVWLKDWCSTDGDILMDINRYGNLSVRNELEYPFEGQVVCSADTLMGTGTYRTTATDTIITFDITDNKASGSIQIHKISGIKK